MPDHAASPARAGGGVTGDRGPRRGRGGPRAVRAGEVVPRVLTRLGLAEGVERWRAVVEWPSIVGEDFARRWPAERVDGDVLWLEVEHPGQAFAMTQDRNTKRDLLTKLERHLGGPRIRDIRFALKTGGR